MGLENVNDTAFPRLARRSGTRMAMYISSSQQRYFNFQISGLQHQHRLLHSVTFALQLVFPNHFRQVLRYSTVNMKSFILVTAFAAASMAHVAHPDHYDKCEPDACESPFII